MQLQTRTLPPVVVALSMLATLAFAAGATAAPRPVARRQAAAKAPVAPVASAPTVPVVEILQPTPEAHAFRGSAYIIRWRCPSGRAADTVRVILACQPPQGGPVQEFWSTSVPNALSAKVRIPADLELPADAPVDSFRLGLQQQLPGTVSPAPPVTWQVLRLH